MKKFTFLFVFTFLIATVFAQKPTNPWWVGSRFGINFSTINGKWSSNDTEKSKPIVTPLVGFASMYSFTDKIFVRMELNLQKTGTVYQDNDDDNEGGEYTLRERYTTLNIPITARYNFGYDWIYFAYAGFYWSKILCGKYIYKEGTYEETGKIKYGEEPDDYNGDDWYRSKEYNRRMDFGIVFGGGVQKELGPGNIGVDLRFGFGFLDVFKWPEGDDKPDGYKPYRNRVINLAVTYDINLD